MECVTRADELQYLFLPTVISDTLEGHDAQVGDMMTKAWTDFAKTPHPLEQGSHGHKLRRSGVTSSWTFVDPTLRCGRMRGLMGVWIIGLSILDK